MKPIVRDDKPMKENGKYPVNYLIRLDRIQIKIPAKRDVDLKYWDKKSGKILRGYPNATIINGLFDKRIDEFTQFMVKNELAGRVVTKEVVKDFFHGNSKMSFYDFYQKQLELWKSRLRESTLTVYLIHVQLNKV